jgi:HD-GYP domain-containing protein (c-di-GMP phosphodiesterase class II)
MRESILNKPGRLTDEEYEIVKQHPVIGAEILRPLITDTCVICGVRHHHERYDGRGYPDKLVAESIPHEARILSVADTYDAMTTNRAYRSGMPHDKAMAEIERCSGGQFDPIMPRHSSVSRTRNWRGSIELSPSRSSGHSNLKSV